MEMPEKEPKQAHPIDTAIRIPTLHPTHRLKSDKERRAGLPPSGFFFLLDPGCPRTMYLAARSVTRWLLRGPKLDPSADPSTPLNTRSPFFFPSLICLYLAARVSVFGRPEEDHCQMYPEKNGEGNDQ